ncbi:hypothetical protein GCM10010080_30900 [Thermomonas carbonis]|nr:hypothetical protein GCM10010080_30900 [Thermomonas carbonis]
MKYLRLASVSVLIFVVVACTKSGYSNCVQVEDEKDFTGEWLKASGTEEKRTVRTEECVALDRAQDSGNGPKTGKVRWAECLSGPDCDETGECGRFYHSAVPRSGPA